MTLSEQLAKFAERAKQTEEHVATAQAKARPEVEQEVETARASAQARADKLRQTADAQKGKILDTWHAAQRTWDQHIAEAHERFAAKKTEVDADRAEHRAKVAESEALYAIEWAYAALEEAEYAALDACLARMEADQLVGAAVS